MQNSNNEDRFEFLVYDMHQKGALLTDIIFPTNVVKVGAYIQYAPRVFGVFHATPWKQNLKTPWSAWKRRQL